jgi:hypothetical protein
MSEASIDVIVEVVETFYPGQGINNDQFLWDLHIRWYGNDQILSGYITAGQAVDEAIKMYPGWSIRAEVIPLGTGEIVSA